MSHDFFLQLIHWHWRQIFEKQMRLEIVQRSDILVRI